MTTKTMKYEIKYESSLYNLLSDIQYEVFLIKNKATSIAYDWQNFSFSYHNRFGEYPKDKNITGVTLTADINRMLKVEHAKSVYSMTRETAVKEAVDKFKTDIGRIMKGEISVMRYKRDGSFPIRAKQINHLNKINSKKYTCKLALLSKEGAKERELKNGQLDIELRTGKGAYEILDRIIDGSYKLCDSRITKNKNKFYLLVTYSFESKKEDSLQPNKIMGIDLGVKIPAMLAISDDKYYHEAVGDSTEISNFQKQVESRKRALQRQRKWCGEGSIGHGTKTRIKPLEKLSGKIKNFKDAKNHCWSRYIVDQAVKNKCGVIQMEDLSGIAEDNTFLKTWTYYDLQQKIKYKAEEKGIKVVMINPYKTSQRCSCCGHISKDNRDASKDQAKFECVNCGTKMNADLNAAKNIATDGIEDIIKEQLELQEKAIKHNMKYAI
jgi:putative transposase